MCRLKERFELGVKTDKVKVDDVRKYLLSSGMQALSKEECGRIVRKTFPGVWRKSSNSSWCYYGLRPIRLTSTWAGAPMVATARETVSDGSKSAKYAANNTLSAQNNSVVTTAKKAQFTESSGESPSPLPQVSCSITYKKKRPQNLKPFKIPSLNLCKEDFSDLHKGHTIGEGTFGKCIAGTYKGIPTAYKIFKTSNYRDVHAEADVLLRIPSHPGIAMLIGVLTTEVPHILATKLCTSSGKPQTYSSLLDKQSRQQIQDLPLFLKFLHSVGAALKHMHSAGVLHNDLKGNNVVVEDMQGEKKCVLIDFGKASTFEQAKGLYT